MACLESQKGSPSEKMLAGVNLIKLLREFTSITIVLEPDPWFRPFQSCKNSHF